MGTDCELKAAMPIPNDQVIEENIELEENEDPLNRCWWKLRNQRKNTDLGLNQHLAFVFYFIQLNL
jgi:hypothetical protein